MIRNRKTAEDTAGHFSLEWKKSSGSLTSEGHVAMKKASLEDEAQYTWAAYPLLLPSWIDKEKLGGDDRSSINCSGEMGVTLPIAHIFVKM